MMVRNITAKYTASDDPEFGSVTEEVTLLAPDVIIETEGGELTFLIIEPVKADQDYVEIDRAEVQRFGMAVNNDSTLDYGFLAEAKLLDFVRKFAEK